MTAYPTNAELATPSLPLARAAGAMHPLTIAASIAVIAASTTAMAYMFGIVGPQSRSNTGLSAQASEVVTAKSPAPAVLSPPAIVAPANVATAEPAPVVTAPVVTAPVVTAPAVKPAAPRIVYLPAPKPVAKPVSAPAPVIAQAPERNQNQYPAQAPQSENRDVVATAPVYSPPVYSPPVVAAAPAQVAVSPYSGTVTQIREQTTAATQGNGVGAVIGGVLGGALGNTMGKGGGKVGATVLGAIGGGLIGNSIEKSQRHTKSYVVSVRMDDGSSRQMTYPSAPRFGVGDKIDVRDVPAQQTGRADRTERAPASNQNNPYSNV